MPDIEYPAWDDHRLRWGMPGLRFDSPLPSYITNPPNLNQKGARHNVKLPYDPDELETLGFNAADGAKQKQTAIGLKQNLDTLILADANAYSDGRVGYDTADRKTRDAYMALRIARDNARGWLMTAVGLLKPTLGKKPSAAWAEAGWSDESLAVPNGEDKLMPMLRTQQAYLTAHADLQVNDPRIAYTAVRAGQLLTALDAAVNDDETGVKPCEAALNAALTTRNLTEEALRRRLRGLYSELEQLLDPLSPDWITFGFELPGETASPDAVAALTGEALGGARGKLSWTAAMRASRYQIWKRVKGEAAFVLFARTYGETEKLLEGLTVGAVLEFQVRGVNSNGEGPFSPIAEITVT